MLATVLGHQIRKLVDLFSEITTILKTTALLECSASNITISVKTEYISPRLIGLDVLCTDLVTINNREIVSALVVYMQL